MSKDKDIKLEEESASKRYTYFRRLPCEIHPYLFDFESYPVAVKTKILERVKELVKGKPIRY